MSENNTKKRELLTIVKAAEYLNQSHWTIRKWIRQKRFPYLQVNSRVIRIEKSDLDAFITENKIPAKKI
jgi:excisionase family DNA binding protein